MLRALEPCKSGVEETRQRILAATRELYALKGSKGTTTREVAERANVNEATLFRHFGTKGHLIGAMLDAYCGNSHIPDVLEAVRRAGSLVEQLHVLGRAAIENISRKEDLIKIGMAEEVTNPDGSAYSWRAPLEARRLLADFFRDKIEAGELRGDPQSLARIFMSFFFAHVMARKLWHEAPDPEAAVVSCVDIFLNGARAR